MARKTPTIRHGMLVAQQAGGQGSVSIAVGSDAWFAWLERERTFAFEDEAGRFSARKKRRLGGAYWYALRRKGGRLREVYLGKGATIRLDRLRAAATKLRPEAVQGTPPGAPPPSSSRRPARAGEPPAARFLPRETGTPPARPSLLARPRTLALLARALERPLTVVSAPAGYGKTTAIAQWAATSRLPFAWVSLDAGDNDPARFWAHVSAALDQIVPGLFAAVRPLIRVPHPHSPDAIIAALNRGLSAAPDPTVLALDEYHALLADNTPLHRAVASLVRHLPSHVRLVLISREEPPLPLAWLRAHGRLFELHAAELRLIPEETAALLAQCSSSRPSPEETAALLARTEGWVAGVKLAALSRPDGAHGIVTFGGANRFVFDYFVEETLRRLPTGLRTYLLRVSVLDRLTAPLCDAVAGMRGGQAMLEELERRELFIEPLDDRREWYRLHALCADALRRHLRQTQPEHVADLYARASAWYEADGDVLQAIDCALAASDPGRAARLLEAHARAALEGGYLASLRAWIERLPDEVVRERPRLCVAHACALVTRGERATAHARLREAEEALARAGHALAPSDLAILRAEITALLIDLRSHSGEDGPAVVLALCRQALAVLPRDHPFHDRVTAFMGLNQLMEGDAQAASGTLGAQMRASEAGGDAFSFRASLLNLGVATHLRGRLDEALDLCRHGARPVEDDGDVTAAAAADLIRGRVLYERNDLAAAVRHLRLGVAVRFDQAVSLGEGYPALAYAYRAQGNDAAARDAIERALADWELAQAESRHPWAWTGDLIRAHQARLWLLQGAFKPASLWARDFERRANGEDARRDVIPAYLREWEEMVLARAYLTEGRATDALARLETLEAAAVSARRIPRLLELLTLQAIAYDMLGDADAALGSLRWAVGLAAPERFIRTLVDGGPAVQRMLSLLPPGRAAQGTSARRAERASLMAYLGALLAAFGPAEPDARQHAASHAGTAGADANTAKPLAKRLTARERQVLRLIAEGASNRDIAQKLVIALATVKSHVTNILQKLGVESRTQALARARALHLLDAEGAPRRP